MGKKRQFFTTRIIDRNRKSPLKKTQINNFHKQHPLEDAKICG